MRSMDTKEYIASRIALLTNREQEANPVVACVFPSTLKACVAKIKVMNYLLDRRVTFAVKNAIYIRVYEHDLYFLSENCTPHDVVGKNFIQLFEYTEHIEAWCEEQQRVIEDVEVAKWMSWGAMSSFVYDSAGMKCAKKIPELKGLWS